MVSVAFIIGSGRIDLVGKPLDRSQRKLISSEFGSPSDVPVKLETAMSSAYLMYRHGNGHNIVPHKINYRANISCLNDLHVREIIAINTVGGIAQDATEGELIVPDQLIDYTWGREHTFCDEKDLKHTAFDMPYAASTRRKILVASNNCGIPIKNGGVYGCTQGPRFETPAEILRMERDGCTIVGMTGMPEAILAKELGIDYASVCLVVNPAAGKGKGVDIGDIQKISNLGMAKIERLLLAFLKILEEGN